MYLPRKTPGPRASLMQQFAASASAPSFSPYFGATPANTARAPSGGHQQSFQKFANVGMGQQQPVTSHLKRIGNPVTTPINANSRTFVPTKSITPLLNSGSTIFKPQTNATATTTASQPRLRATAQRSWHAWFVRIMSPYTHNT